MIIVSQNKKIAINFKKVLSVYRSKQEISAEYPFEDGYANLAMYKSEKRTEEVFKELMKKYENWENMRCGQSDEICSSVYYMPVE